MKFIRKVLIDRSGRLNWPAGVFFITIIIYAAYEIAECFLPLQGLPPVEERIADIKKMTDPNDFCFAVIGDSHSKKEVLSKILSSINQDPDIAFVVHTGDALKKPRKTFFRDFLETIDALLHKPFLCVPGNHDTDREDEGMFEHAFGQRQNVFSIGDTRFVLANTEVGPLSLRTEAGRNWLRQALHQKENGGNSVVFMHKPLYDPRGNGAHHSLPKRVSEKLLEIFNTYHVSHIFTGHVHGHWTGLWGTVPYTVSGGAGGTFYTDDPSHGFHHYLKVRIRNGRIEEKAVAIEKNVLSQTTGVIQTYALSELRDLIFIAIIVCSILLSAWKWTSTNSNKGKST